VFRHVQPWPHSLPEPPVRRKRRGCIRASGTGQRETEPPQNGQDHVDRGHGGHRQDGDAPSQRAQGPLAAAPRSERRLASTRIRIRVMGVITPSRTWVFRIRVIRLPGHQHHGRPDQDLGGEQAQEEGGLAEARRHRALDPDRLGHGVGGRERAPRRPPGPRRPGGPSPKSTSAAGRPPGAGRGRRGRPRSGGPVPPMVAPVATMIDMATNAARTAPTMASTRWKWYSSGLTPLVHHGAGLVQLDVRRDGGADEGHRQQEERLAGDEVGHKVLDATWCQLGWPSTAAMG
jgi:hypothetical protein